MNGNSHLDFYQLQCHPLHFTRSEFMAVFTTLSVVIWFSTGTLGIFATLVYVFTMRVVIYDVIMYIIYYTLLYILYII